MGDDVELIVTKPLSNEDNKGVLGLILKRAGGSVVREPSVDDQVTHTMVIVPRDQRVVFEDDAEANGFTVDFPRPACISS